jgi:hypothetical protein
VVRHADASPPPYNGTVRWQEAIRELIDKYRDRCLWFLRSDYYPATPEEAEQVLQYIERYGDLEAFRRAARIRPRLSPRSSAKSAAS